MQSEVFNGWVDRLGKNFSVRGVTLEDKKEILWEEFNKVNEDVWIRSCKYLLENKDRFPKIKEFKETIQSVAFSITPTESIKVECNNCGGSGFIMTVKDCGKWNEYTMWNDYAFRCSCQNGAVLSAKIPVWHDGWREKNHIPKNEIIDKDFETNEDLRRYTKEMMDKRKNVFKEVELIFSEKDID